MHKTLWVLVGFGLVVILALVVLQLVAHFGYADPPYRYFKIFSEVLYLVDQKYVDPPNYEHMRRGALVGIAKSLGENASIMDEADREFLEHRPAGLGEPGIRILDRGSFFLILAVLPNSPAADAGLVPGDRVFAINDLSAVQMNSMTAYRLLFGPLGSTVQLAVYRVQKRKAEYLELRRMEQPPVVVRTTYDASQRRGVIHLYRLGTVGDRMVADQLRLWSVQGLDALVLDLRQCTDLHYETARRLADLFLDQGSSGLFRGRKQVDWEERPFQPATTLYHEPLGVIVDRSTGWACELLAWFLQQSGRATTVGQPTAGMVAWYATVRLQEGLYLWLPVARFQGTKEHAFSKEGLKPSLAYPQKVAFRPPAFIYDDDVVTFVFEKLASALKKVA